MGRDTKIGMPRVGEDDDDLGLRRKKSRDRDKPRVDWVKSPDPLGKTFTCFPFKDDHRGRLKYTEEAGYRGVFNADKLKGKNAKAVGFNPWNKNPMQRGFTPFKPLGVVMRPVEGKYKGEEITVVKYNDGRHKPVPHPRFGAKIKRKRPFGSTALPCTDEFSAVVRTLQHCRAIGSEIRIAKEHKAGPLRAESCPPLTLSGWETRPDVTRETVEEIARCTRSSAGSYGFGCTSTDRIRRTFNRKPGINKSFGGDPATTLAMRFRGMP